MLDADALLAGSRRPIVIGTGGGGDVVGALAVAEPLRRIAGARPTVGGATWERTVVDPHPGPRRLGEIAGAIEELGSAALLAGSDTRVRESGVHFSEARVAGAIGEQTLLVDPSDGPLAVADGLAAAIARLDADLLVLLDVGGDVLAHGDEEGLSSPLCDAVMLAGAAHLAERGAPVMGAVFGPACDGELELAELLGRVAEVAAGGGIAGARWLTASTVALLERVIEVVPTEASAQPLRAFRGEVGMTTIRGGRREVALSPLGPLTVFFDVSVALETAARLARAVQRCASLEEANDVLHGLGVRTELDYERAALEV
ncbi:MAG TPA: DUF1152 domain-containing protein [Thermoleophilaceae bacterium]|nr:DUF1152 domain-containing protein [Thermoleophilaceae bacterium]